MRNYLIIDRRQVSIPRGNPTTLFITMFGLKASKKIVNQVQECLLNQAQAMINLKQGKTENKIVKITNELIRFELSKQTHRGSDTCSWNVVNSFSLPICQGYIFRVMLPNQVIKFPLGLLMILQGNFHSRYFITLPNTQSLAH